MRNVGFDDLLWNAVGEYGGVSRSSGGWSWNARLDVVGEWSRSESERGSVGGKGKPECLSASRRGRGSLNRVVKGGGEGEVSREEGVVTDDGGD